MMTIDLGRQFATGAAAFIVTATLLLATAPTDARDGGPRPSGGQEFTEVRAVPTHG